SERARGGRDPGVPHALRRTGMTEPLARGPAGMVRLARARLHAWGGMAGQELSTAPRAWRHAPARTALIGAAVLAVAVLAVGEVGCLLLGRSPWLPPVLALLAFLAVRPTPGLGYAIVVLTVPLGLWAIGVQGLVGAAFGGRDYLLGLSAVAVVFV